MLVKKTKINPLKKTINTLVDTQTYKARNVCTIVLLESYVILKTVI